MPRIRYQVDSSRSRVIVTARSSVHDTETRWTSMSGYIEVDPEDPGAGADAVIDVDMADFDAGDWLKNRKLKKDLQVDAHPRARFELGELVNVTSEGTRTSAEARGRIDWRNHQADIEAKGSATLTSGEVDAHAHFELDVRKLGVTPPRILMIKVEDVVSVVVELVART